MNAPGRRRGDWRLHVERAARPPATSAQLEEIGAWVASALPREWFAGSARVEVDDYEVLVVGVLVGGDDDDVRRIERFREATHLARAAIAREAAQRFARRLSWGIVSGAAIRYFNVAHVPTTTKLQLRQRRTLERLVEGGLAKDRSEALAWCVDLVARHEADWLEQVEGPAGELGGSRHEPRPPRSG